MVELRPGTQSAALQLEHPLIYSENTLRIGQIKKYLKHQLLDTNGSAHTQWQISCHEIPLGDELSLNFVLRTVWREPGKMLQLLYTEERTG
jgi:hypothetical protein